MIDFSHFLQNVPLKDYCTFKIGGNAKYVYYANTTKQLIEVCDFCNIHNIKYKIIGLGANLLFDDNGYDGLIIVNKTKKILFKSNFVYADGGVNLSELISVCQSKKLSNFESLAGIPATLAGAVVNNVGAFETEIGCFVEYVECYHKSDLTKKLKLKHRDCLFSYRHSIFKNNEYIITRIKLRLSFKSAFTINQNIKRAIYYKSSTQPVGFPCAGSIFKRCTIIPAKVIDELGLKGTKIGGAEISTKHAGFIVNTANATSQDVKDLIVLIKNKVKQHYNADLPLEIEIVN